MLNPKQIEERLSGIGSSEVAAVVGISPFQGPMEIYNVKTGIDEIKPNRFMVAGQWLEDSVANWHASEAGVKLMRCNRTLRHRKHPWALATPDRWVLRERKRDRLCEIKCVGNSTSGDWGEEGSEEIPTYYFSQVQWQMEVVNIDSCDVVVFFLDSRRLQTYHVIRHRELGAVLLEQVGEFWNEHVVKRIPPTLDSSEASSRLLKKLFPGEESETIVDAPNDAAKWVAQYQQSSEQVKLSEAAKDEAGNYLKAMIGKYAGVRGPWGSATWKTTSGGGTDYKKLFEYLVVGLHLGGLVDAGTIKEHFQIPGHRRFNLSKKRKG